MNYSFFGYDTLLSGAFPFPAISWWKLALRLKKVKIDAFEHYQKMGSKNRYFLAGTQGKQLMSIPLKNGRNQRVPMAKLFADSHVDWQTKHWRTIQSLYGRSPFFEYYEDDLRPLFTNQEAELNLVDWCCEGIKKVAALLECPIELSLTSDFQVSYPENVLDIRFKSCSLKNEPSSKVIYHQVFQDRIGFLEDCSVLDLLFCKGRQAKELLLL